MNPSASTKKHESSQTSQPSITHVEGYEQIVTRHGIALVPQPSSDPLDPLNWPQSKKFVTLLIISLASFGATLQSVANSSGLFFQAALYEKTPTQVSYSISAGIAGLAAGPFFWAPLSRKFGRCGCIAWSNVIALGCTIWGALMTGPNDYIPFILSRLFGSLMASCATTVGAGMIAETFFLHERGKAFSFYTIMILLGTIAGPTFSGYIVTSQPWPVQYWYVVGLEGLVIILMLVFVDETGWTRPGGLEYPKPASSRRRRIIGTYLFTRPIVPYRSFAEIMKLATVPFAIMVTPITLLTGIFLLVIFAWAVGVSTLLAVFLQTPVELGGYGFSTKTNADFTFASWFSIIAAQAYGYFLSDRLPLWLTKHNGGTWKPEYRLHCLWFPACFLMPVGLGLFGASLKYHLHFMAAAFGVFLLNAGAISIVPVTTNYLVECYTTHPMETATTLNFYRLVFGLALPFFIDPWEAAVGVGWVFGMMGFFTLFAFICIIVLIFKGDKIREIRIGGLGSTEAGARIVATPEAEKSDV